MRLNLGSLLMLLAVVAFVGLIYVLYDSYRKDEDCRARGGVRLKTGSAFVCVKADVLE